MLLRHQAQTMTKNMVLKTDIVDLIAGGGHLVPYDLGGSR